MTAPRTAYDEFAYPTPAFPQTHPNRLAAIATLLGLSPAPPARCRVLEVGCGSGENLIALGMGAPDSTFVGFDLAESAIAKGRAIVAELGLTNVHLSQGDLMEWTATEPFDYIIAHGLLSWVPPPVQKRLFELFGSALAPQGVAYVSYNTYPGFHARRMLRDMMRMHTAAITDPRRKIDQARGLLQFLIAGQTKTDEFSALMKKEAEWALERDSDALLYHDDLADVNIPFWIHELAQIAAEHGLQFLAEADYFEMYDRDYPSAVTEAMSKLGDNIVMKEQYLDFLKCRRFRQTLLVRDDLAIDRDIKPERIQDMLVASPAQPKSERVNLSAGAIEAFQGPRGGAMQIDHPLTKAAMLVLKANWPKPIPFAELVAAARQMLGPDSPDTTDDDVDILRQVMVSTFANGIVALHTHRPHWVTEVSDRPVASPLLRLQLRQGRNKVISLRPYTVQVDLPFFKALFQLLDGTRDRADLEREMRRRIEAGEVTLPEGAILTDLPARIESGLRQAATEALLIA